MRKYWILTLAAIVGVLITGAVASADEHEHPLPPHPHILLIGADIDIDFTMDPPFIVNSYERCVDIAANRTLPLNAHHEHFHFGAAGDALRGMTGNFPFPAAPFPGVPFANCAEFEAIFGS